MGIFSFFKSGNYFDKNIAPKCDYCRYGKRAKDGNKVLCEQRGLVDSSYSCNKFIYSPLKRIPVKQLNFVGSLADEDLYIESAGDRAEKEEKEKTEQKKNADDAKKKADTAKKKADEEKPKAEADSKPETADKTEEQSNKEAPNVLEQTGTPEAPESDKNAEASSDVKPTENLDPVPEKSEVYSEEDKS